MHGRNKGTKKKQGMIGMEIRKMILDVLIVALILLSAATAGFLLYRLVSIYA